MHSRERLLTALAGEAPDRVPVSVAGWLGHSYAGFVKRNPSYARIMEAVREKTDCISNWHVGGGAGFLASAYPLESDIEKRREGNATVTTITTHTPKGDLRHRMVHIDDFNTTWKIEYPCKNLDDVDKALSVPYKPAKWDPAGYEEAKESLGNRGIMMSGLTEPFFIAATLMSFQDCLLWIKTETEHFARVVEIVAERFMENLKGMLDAAVVDLYRICGPEYATPPYLPPEFFRRFELPYLTQMVEMIHSHGARARTHCHGRIKDVLDMILATGADALEPCEPPPDGDMPLEEVKRCVGREMCLLGNIELDLLERGSEQEVEAAVKECMRAAKQGGGYIIMPTAFPVVALSEQTERNFLRYIDTALEYGQY